jgi:hypothetical protein
MVKHGYLTSYIPNEYFHFKKINLETTSLLNLKMNKIIIAGTRTFEDFELLEHETKKFILENDISLPISIVSGKAKGADSLGEIFAKKYNFPIIEKPADWEKLGRRAGPIRNEEMAKISNFAIIFWDGKSRGSANMAELAEKYKLTFKIVRYE